MDLKQIKKEFTDLVENFDRSFRDMILSQKFIVKTKTNRTETIFNSSIDHKVLYVKHPYNENIYYIIGSNWTDIEKFFELRASLHGNNKDYYTDVFKEEIETYKTRIEWLDTGCDDLSPEVIEKRKEYIRNRILSKH